MVDIKLSCTILVPGIKMYAPLGYGEDTKKYDRNTHNLNKLDIKTTRRVRKGNKIINEKVSEVLLFTTPKSKLVNQVINIDRVAYLYFISNEVPKGFKLEGEEKFKVRQLISTWMRMSKDQKITWHLNRIAEDLGGQLLSFQVLED